MGPAEILSVARDLGGIGLLVVFVYGGMKGWWVFGRHHDESMALAQAKFEQMREDRNYWRDVALEGVQTAKEGIALAERRAT